MNIFGYKLKNQALGLIPLLVFMFLNNYYSYYSSFLVSMGLCLAGLIAYRLLKRDLLILLMLLPTVITLCVYSLFLFFKIEPVLLKYSSLLIEVVLVVVLAVIGFSKRTVLRKNRMANHPGYKRTYIRTALNEFFFLIQLVQGLYTLHLFIVLIYTTLSESMQGPRIGDFLYNELGIIIGIVIILYEQIRLTLMRGSLKKEMWLPVLDDKLKVVGCIARSVSRSLPKKYFHPIVRNIVISEGMIYMEKRAKEDYVSADTYDSPFSRYLLFRHTVEATVRELLGEAARDKDVHPRFLIRYVFENEKVKHLVYLHVVCLKKQGKYVPYRKKPGKYWTVKQIEENLHSGVFSEYFEMEYPYLKQTILFAESFNCKPPVEATDPVDPMDVDQKLSLA